MQYAKNEKTTIIFIYKQNIQGTICCGGMIFSRKCSTSSDFIQSRGWNCIQYIFISKSDMFSYALGLFEIGFK